MDSLNIITDMIIYNYQPTINMCTSNANCNEKKFGHRLHTYYIFIASILSLQSFVTDTFRIDIIESLHTCHIAITINNFPKMRIGITSKDSPIKKLMISGTIKARYTLIPNYQSGITYH